MAFWRLNQSLLGGNIWLFLLIYINTTDFYIFIFYLVPLLNSLISSSGFLVDSIGFSINIYVSLKLCQLSQRYPLKQKDPAQNHMLHLVVLWLSSPSIWRILVLSWTFMTVTLLKITGSYFVECSSIWYVLIYPCDRFSLCIFVRNYNRSDVLIASHQPIHYFGLSH